MSQMGEPWELDEEGGRYGEKRGLTEFNGNGTVQMYIRWGRMVSGK
jgi:hypothetical protein